MSKGKISFRFYGVKGIVLVALALTLTACIAAFGAGFSRPVFLDQAFDVLRPDAILLSRSPSALGARSATSPLDVAVSMPNVSSTPGVVLIPITVGDLTSLQIFSFDLQVTFDPSVVAPASPAFFTPGTLSSSMAITTNTTNPGHLILGAFQGSPLDGSGTLIFLRFSVIGTPGQSSSLIFENYVDPSSAPHTGFRFNEGTPAALTTNGSLTVVGVTPTNTATNTPTSTPTATNTPTFSPTNTPSFTPTRTPTGTATNTPAFTATSTASPTATATPICGVASMPALTTLTNTLVTVPVNTADMAGTGANSVSLTVTYSPGVMSFTGVTFGPIGTSNGGGRTLSFSTPTSGTINISIFGGNEFIGSGTLVNLNFSVFALPGTQSLLSFNSFSINGGQSCGTFTNGSVTVVAGTISGNVTYANAIGPPAPRYVPGVSVVASGSPSVAATTDALGVYLLSGFGAGSYSISPFKTGGTNGAISGFDAARVAQYVVQLISFTPTQIAAADVSGGSGVSSFDSTLIARYIVALPSSGMAGEWVFSPANIFHGAIYSNIANENYAAILMGDVSGNWNSPNALPGRSAGSSGPQRSAAVTAPRLIAPADGDVVIPVNIQGAVNKGIISYEFDLGYDSTVIQPQAGVIDLSGTVSRGLTAVANPIQPGLLRVAVFGPMPIDSNGVLLNLRFTAVGAPGAVSPLTWERLVLNEGDPRVVTVDGSVEISKAGSSDAEIGGRVLNAFGEGVSGARVTLTDTTGRSRSMLTNGFGSYRFGGLQTGETYTVTVNSKQYAFTPLTVSATGQLTNQDIVADQ